MSIDPLKFIQDNIYLVVIALISGGMLIWPLIRGRGETEVGTLEATQLINHKEALLIDVRDAGDFAKSHILNARSLPISKLDSDAESIAKNKQKPLIVYCEAGRQAGGAAKKLREKGYENVVSLSGGIAAWRQAGLPVGAG